MDIFQFQFNMELVKIWFFLMYTSIKMCIFRFFRIFEKQILDTRDLLNKHTRTYHLLKMDSKTFKIYTLPLVFDAIK